MLKIRLARFGRKKLPHYKIVVAQNTAPRDGRFIEQIGTYSPLLDKADSNRLKVNKERFSYWVSVGAKPTQRIAKFLQTT
jgi:small subunit ribosomal protein S16